MECKVLCMARRQNRRTGIDLTRMECKAKDYEEVVVYAEEYRFNQNGM